MDIHDRRSYDGLTQEAKLDMIISKVETILEGFPYGVEHHKQDHIDRQADKDASKELIKSLKSSFIKSAINGILIVVGALLLTGIVTRFKEFLLSMH